MEVWHTRIKHFPDGGLQYTFYDTPIVTGVKRAIPKEDKPEGFYVDKKEHENAKRALREVYDLARSNKFDWFVTLTMSPDRVDRTDYDACVAELMKFTDVLRKAGCKWIIVPEEHKKGGWHFHGLIQGELKLERATNFHTGEPLSDQSGRPIYNILNYKYGFNTATPISSAEKVASYVAKYLTKDMHVPKGKKRYWASKTLERPTLEYDNLSVDDQRLIEEISSFVKRTDLRYGLMTICELGFGDDAFFDVISADLKERRQKECGQSRSEDDSDFTQLKIEQNRY